MNFSWKIVFRIFSLAGGGFCFWAMHGDVFCFWAGWWGSLMFLFSSLAAAGEGDSFILKNSLNWRGKIFLHCDFHVFCLYYKSRQSLDRRNVNFLDAHILQITLQYLFISIKSIKNELSSSNTYQFVRSSYNSVSSINDSIEAFTNSYGLSISQEMIDIPLFYFIPKMHKDPVGKRFIAGSKKCSIKVISKLFSKCLKLILNHLKKYDSFQ